MKNFFSMLVILGITCIMPAFCTNESKAEVTTVEVGSKDNNPFILLTRSSSIRVQQGDNLWDLSMDTWGDHDWERFMVMNPFLLEPGRITQNNGKTIVFIYPGEELMFDESQPTPIPVEVKEDKTEKFDDQPFPWWVWWLTLAFILLFYYMFFFPRKRKNKEREALKADPVNQGPPVVKGGIDDNNVRSHLTSSGLGFQRIGRIYKGKAYSDGRLVQTQYGDNRDRPAPLNGEDAYRAELLDQDHKVIGYRLTLAACANDIRSGSKGLPSFVRFVADEVQPEVLNPVVSCADAQVVTTETVDTKGKSKASVEEKVTNETPGDLVSKMLNQMIGAKATGTGTVGGAKFEITGYDKDTQISKEEA